MPGPNRRLPAGTVVEYRPGQSALRIAYYIAPDNNIVQLRGHVAYQGRGYRMSEYDPIFFEHNRDYSVIEECPIRIRKLVGREYRA